MSHEIAEGLHAIAQSLDRVAKSIDRLGTGNACTDMGAIEFLGTCVEKSGAAVEAGLHELALEVRGGLDGVACEIRDKS